jgi:EF hand
MKMKTLPLALSTILLSSASLIALAADEPAKPAADQGTSMEQPDKAKADQGAKPNDQGNAANQGQKPAKDATAQMKDLDTNGDGSITKAEAGKMKGMTEGFDAADKNKDGKLDAGEFTTAMSQMK